MTGCRETCVEPGGWEPVECGEPVWLMGFCKRHWDAREGQEKRAAELREQIRRHGNRSR